jgi:hypothetical protein
MSVTKFSNSHPQFSLQTGVRRFFTSLDYPPLEETRAFEIKFQQAELIAHYKEE